MTEPQDPLVRQMAANTEVIEALARPVPAGPEHEAWDVAPVPRWATGTDAPFGWAASGPTLFIWTDAEHKHWRAIYDLDSRAPRNLGREEYDARHIADLLNEAARPVPAGPEDEHAEWYRQGWEAGNKAARPVPAVDGRERLAATLRHTEDRSLAPHDDRYYHRWADRILRAGVSTGAATPEPDRLREALDVDALIRNIEGRIDAAAMGASVGQLSGSPVSEAIAWELGSLLVDITEAQGRNAAEDAIARHLEDVDA